MGRGYAGRKLMVEYFTNLLRERRANPGQDMFSQFALARREDGAKDEQGDLLPEDVVVDHMIFLMMAAHDTTTITLSSVMYFLARHPEWQARQAALSQVPGNR